MRRDLLLRAHLATAMLDEQRDELVAPVVLLAQLDLRRAVLHNHLQRRQKRALHLRRPLVALARRRQRRGQRVRPRAQAAHLLAQPLLIRRRRRRLLRQRAAAARQPLPRVHQRHALLLLLLLAALALVREDVGLPHARAVAQKHIEHPRLARVPPPPAAPLPPVAPVAPVPVVHLRIEQVLKPRSCALLIHRCAFAKSRSFAALLTARIKFARACRGLCARTLRLL